jgi:uncharacterized protein (TIGR03067 family)
VIRVAIAAVLFLSGANTLRAEDKAKELDGVYAIVSVRKGAEELLGDTKDATVKFEGATMTVTFPDRMFTATVKRDATKTPATIDIAPADGKDKGKTFPGVYGQDGDTLTIAFVEEGKRPTDLKDTNAVVLKLKKR